MPKLLACCEYYIAADPLNRFGLSNLLSIEESLPKRSTLRITAALCVALKYSKVGTYPYTPGIDSLQQAGAFYKMAQGGRPP